MPISFECDNCGKSFTAPDKLAGRTGQCKQCGHAMTIPSASSDPDGYDIELEPDDEELAPIPPRASASKPAEAAPARRPLFEKAPKAASSGPGKNKKMFGGVAWAAIVIVGLIFRVYNRWDRAQARNGQDAQASAQPFGPSPAVARTGPIPLPPFPDPGPPREIEPGVSFREVDLGPDRPGIRPGWSGKIWIYTPSGDHAPRSLPCVLITGAGSNLITGMKLGDGDRPEHLPYVRAGFAVVAFELDGMPADLRTASNQEMNRCMRRFLDARAGLVNGQIALEYALAKVPEVDPARLTAAGHSSAATFALLFAENEPRLRSCIAFAPVADIAANFQREYGAAMVASLRIAGGGDFLGRYSPRTDEAKLDRPVFLFYAKDDQNAPELDAFEARMRSAGRPITVATVPSGGHYDPMIRQGIPAAIGWLQGRETGGQ